MQETHQALPRPLSSIVQFLDLIPALPHRSRRHPPFPPPTTPSTTLRPSHTDEAAEEEERRRLISPSRGQTHVGPQPSSRCSTLQCTLHSVPPPLDELSTAERTQLVPSSTERQGDPFGAPQGVVRFRGCVEGVEALPAEDTITGVSWELPVS